MKKITVLLFAFLFVNASFAQSATADSTKENKVSLLLGSEAEFQILKTILLQSRLQLAGQSLTAQESLQLLQWLDSRKSMESGEQPSVSQKEKTIPADKKKAGKK